MAEKESFDLSKPLYTLGIHKGNNRLVMNLPKLITILWFGIVCINFVNLFAACYTGFSWAEFAPSLDYLGCFRGHDRIYMLSCVYSAIVLCILCFGMQNRFRNVYRGEIKTGILYLNYAIVLLLPLLGYTNEINGEHFVSFETLHPILTKIFLLLIAFWVGIHYSTLQKCRLNADEKKGLPILKVTMVLLGILGIALIFVRRSKQAGEDWASGNLASFIDWTCMTILSFLPAIFGRFLRGFQVTLNVASKIKD